MMEHDLSWVDIAAVDFKTDGNAVESGESVAGAVSGHTMSSEENSVLVSHNSVVCLVQLQTETQGLIGIETCSKKKSLWIDTSKPVDRKIVGADTGNHNIVSAPFHSQAVALEENKIAMVESAEKVFRGAQQFNEHCFLLFLLATMALLIILLVVLMVTL
jgi:hypothetical protein